jgi:predicted transcriptional regulator
VTVSLAPDLARALDRFARLERRSRAELMREAFRQYVRRLERWDQIFTSGDEAARRARATEPAVLRAVKERRRAHLG